MKDINKILLITLTNIGDAVLTLPVALVLKERFPSAQLDVLLGPRAQGLFRKIPYFHQTIVYDKRITLSEKIKLVLKLRKEKYDLIVDLRHSLFPLFIGARYHTPLLFRVPEQIRHKRDFHLYKLKLSGVDFTPSESPGSPWAGKEYLPRTNVLVRGLLRKGRVKASPFLTGVTNFSFDNPLGISADEERRIDELLADKGIYPEDKLIVLAPGARDKKKRWDPEKFACLVDKLTEQGKVILVGGAEEKGVINEVISLTAEKPLRLDGEIDLKELAVLLKRCTLFIGNDSAPMQIASLLRTPTIGIFGPTDVQRFKPLGKKSRVIKNGSSMNSVKPEEVLEAARELLKDSPC